MDLGGITCEGLPCFSFLKMKRVMILLIIN